MKRIAVALTLLALPGCVAVPPPHRLVQLSDGSEGYSLRVGGSIAQASKSESQIITEYMTDYQLCLDGWSVVTSHKLFPNNSGILIYDVLVKCKALGS